MMLSASRAAAVTGTILLFGSICIAGGLPVPASEGRFSQCNSNGGCSRLLLPVALPLAPAGRATATARAAATQWHPGRHGGLRVGLESDHPPARHRWRTP